MSGVKNGVNFIVILFIKWHSDFSDVLYTTIYVETAMYFCCACC